MMKKWNWLPLLLLTALLIAGCAKNPEQAAPAGEEQTVGTHQQKPTVTDPQEIVQDIEPEVTFGDDNWQPNIQSTAPDGKQKIPGRAASFFLRTNGTKIIERSPAANAAGGFVKTMKKKGIGTTQLS